MYPFSCARCKRDRPGQSGYVFGTSRMITRLWMLAGTTEGLKKGKAVGFYKRFPSLGCIRIIVCFFNKRVHGEHGARSFLQVAVRCLIAFCYAEYVYG